MCFETESDARKKTQNKCLPPCLLRTLASSANQREAWPAIQKLRDAQIQTQPPLTPPQSTLQHLNWPQIAGIFFHFLQSSDLVATLVFRWEGFAIDRRLTICRACIDSNFHTIVTKMDDFQNATDRFLSWFKSVGGEFRQDLLEIQDLRARDAGRGISTLKKDRDCWVTSTDTV